MANISVNKVMLLFTVIALVAAMVVPLIEGMKCRIILDISDDWEKLIRDCFESNPPSLGKFPMSNTTMEDYDFDDNCFQQCFYKGAGVLTPEGKLKKETKETVSAYLKKSELDEDILDKITAVYNDCIEPAEKIGKEKGFEECKVLSLHNFCFDEKLYGDKGLLEKKC